MTTVFRFGAILVTVGVVAFLGTHVRSSDGTGSPALIDKPKPNQSFNRRARLVAEKFILTAVARKNTGASWKLVDLSFPGRAEFTKKEWAAGGDIPVVPASFPITGNAIRLSVGDVDAHGSELLLDVVLGLHRKRPEYFELGLRRRGKGAERRWLVDYWMTRYARSYPAPEPVSAPAAS